MKKHYNKERKNPIWKGKNVGYGGIHDWAKRYKSKPKFCQICHKKKNEYRNSKLVLANVSGKYKRNLDDWIYCHQSCHMREHKKGNHKNLKHKKYCKEHIIKDKKYENRKKNYWRNYYSKNKNIKKKLKEKNRKIGDVSKNEK